MNDVPYAFCDAVAAIHHDLRSIRECMNEANSLNWGIWKAAAADHFSKRAKILFHINFNGGNWSYVIDKFDSVGNLTRMDLQDLQAMKWNYVQVEFLTFRSYYNDLKPATFDEIVQILALLSPFTNHAQLFLEQFDAKNSEMSKLITTLYESSFCKINVYQWRNAYRAFLCHQIKKSKSLQYITGEYDYVHFPKDLLARIDRFHRTKQPKRKRS